jgi:hypothetical protein
MGQDNSTYLQFGTTNDMNERVLIILHRPKISCPPLFPLRENIECTQILQGSLIPLKNKNKKEIYTHIRRVVEAQIPIQAADLRDLFNTEIEIVTIQIFNQTSWM